MCIISFSLRTYLSVERYKRARDCDGVLLLTNLITSLLFTLDIRIVKKPKERTQRLFTALIKAVT